MKLFRFVKWLTIHSIFLILAGVITLLVTGCTTIPPAQKTHLNKNDFSFGQHSVIVDKRYDYLGQLCMSDEKSILTYYNFSRWNDNSGVKILFQEMKGIKVYWKNINWQAYYENVLYYEKPQFARAGDIYTWRMIRSKYNEGVLVVSTFHFVGNQQWLIVEYFFEMTESFDYANVKSYLRIADTMINIRHNTVPGVIKTLDSGMERLNTIFFK